MDRRAFLTASGGGAMLGIGGCVGRDPADANSDAAPNDVDDGDQLDTNDPTDRKSYELGSLVTYSERTAPKHRYTVETSHLYESVDDDHTVVDLAELSPEVTSVLETARNESYAADELPDNTRTTIEAYDFIDFGDANGRRYVGFELFEMNLDRPPLLTVDARLLDDTANHDDPAVLEIEAVNDGDEAISWRTGAPRPFGILRANGLLLWTDAYEESNRVWIEDGAVIGSDDVALGVELDPDESAVEQYAIEADRDGFNPGKFTYEGALRTGFEGGRETVAYEISWKIRVVTSDDR